MLLAVPGSLAARVLPAGHGAGGGVVAMVAEGDHIWVVSQTHAGGGSVTERDARDGRWIRTLSGGRYGFRYPVAIAAEDGHIWVANDPQTGDGQTPKLGDGSVTELSARDGQWIRTVSGLRYGFDFPAALAITGNRLWVVNGDGDSVTELDASDGTWVRTLASGRYGFDSPDAIAAGDGHIWIANEGGAEGAGSVTELNAGDGSWIRTLSGRGYGFDNPAGIAVASHRVWVANSWGGAGGDGLDGGGSVTVLNAADGRRVQSLSGGCYFFDNPAAIAAGGGHIWVVNSARDQTGGSVTELDASTGSWIRTLSNDSWTATLIWGGCIRNMLTGGSYHFTNPATITAGGAQVWIGDGTGSITVLSDRR